MIVEKRHTWINRCPFLDFQGSCCHVKNNSLRNVKKAKCPYKNKNKCPLFKSSKSIMCSEIVLSGDLLLENKNLRLEGRKIDIRGMSGLIGGDDYGSF